MDTPHHMTHFALGLRLQCQKARSTSPHSLYSALQVGWHTEGLSFKYLYRGLQVAWHKNRDEIGACAKFGGNFELKFCACANFVAIFVPSNRGTGKG